MYRNRLEAGKVLAEELKKYNFDLVCILGVPRGGIVVAVPIAREFDTGIKALVMRKIGHPAHPELAMGAVMPDGSAILDKELIRRSGVPDQVVDKLVAEQFAELNRRLVLYSGKERDIDVEGKTVIAVDDGIATGYTLKAAVKWLKTCNPRKIILAVPVAPPEAVQELSKEADLVVCPLQPEHFMSVGAFYRDFSQTTDKEVIEILSEFMRDECMKSQDDS